MEAVDKGQAPCSHAERGAGGSEGPHVGHVSRRKAAVLHLLDAHVHCCGLCGCTLPGSSLGKTLRGHFEITASCLHYAPGCAALA